MNANYKAIGIRWSVVESYSDGSQYAVAWNDPAAPHDSRVAEVTLPAGSTEGQVYAALRDTLCRRYGVPAGTGIVNERGDVL